MKKILMTLYIILSFTTLFAKIDDRLGLFKDKVGIEKIEAKVKEMEEMREIRIFVNTFQGGESFITSNPQKIAFFNILRSEDEMYAIDYNFSKDLQLDDYIEDMDLVIDNLSEMLEAGEYEDYILTILDEVDRIIYSADIDNDISEMLEMDDNGRFLSFLHFKSVFKIGGLIFIVGIFGLIIVELLLKKRKASHNGAASKDNGKNSIVRRN